MVINYLLFRINVALGLYLSVGLWIIYLVFRRFVPDTFNNTFQFLIFFDVGIVLSQSRRFIYVIGRIKFLLANVILFAVTEFFYLSGNFPFSSTALAKLLVGVSGAVLVIQLSRLAVERNFLNMLSYIGKRSLPIYLAHMLVASGTRIILLKILKISDLTVNCLAGTLAGVFLPLFLYNLVKKSGYTAWLFTFPKKANKDQVIRTYSLINPA
jgi:peptidoglycan/LPS O-acetylase OafA/YrhL